MKRLDTNPIEEDKNELKLVSCVRNENLRLPYFLEYYRKLGVNCFFFIDNDSTDGTLDFLLSQDDAHVFHTRESYAESQFGLKWTQELREKYCCGSWTLTLDPDELLYFPNSGQETLMELTKRMDQSNYDALPAFLLDMYSNSSLQKSIYKRGDDFLKACNYFDSDSYYQTNKLGIPLRGGPRFRIFWDNSEEVSKPPLLLKTPLVKWKSGLFYKNPHIIEGVQNSHFTGALLHFKFFSNFHLKASEEAARKEHWNEASEYVRYFKKVTANPNLNFMYEGSQAFENSQQLIRLGLMKGFESIGD